MLKDCCDDAGLDGVDGVLGVATPLLAGGAIGIVWTGKAAGGSGVGGTFPDEEIELIPGVDDRC